MSKLIDNIELPTGLRSLSHKELEKVTEEIRDELIETVSECGGHFASSLGVAELSVGLHHVFNTPEDRIVWDVGHQAYIHKMLTGRRSKLPTIRTKDGLSGFLKRSESEYDTFGAGHAGTSISAAVGMATALQKTDPDRSVVAVIGDGSITSGMAFEALNHAGAMELNNLIVVLNDNEMSISPNVGAMSWLFSKAVTSKFSNRARNKFKSLHKKGIIPDIVYKVIDKAEEMTQGYIAGAAVLFEAFGFRYIGPVDGHNIEDVVTALEHAKNQDVPVIIHASTQKGKGYTPAEKDPIKWHGVKPFNRNAGSFNKTTSKEKTPPSYTSVFSDTMLKIAEKNEKLVAITAAMLTGTGLDKFQEKYEDRCYDVGICEQHAVTFAAGLACEGYTPVCAIYSTFLQRAYDQIVHDVCIQNLPVIFAMDRGGLVGNDGETHQGVFDISYLRSLPNLVVAAPRDENELQHMLYTGTKHHSPFALRYPRGNGEGVQMDSDLKEIKIGKSLTLQKGKDILFLCYGNTSSTAIKTSEKILDSHGYTSTVVDMRFVKPIDLEVLKKEIPNHDYICTLEENVLMGGFNSAVLEALNKNNIDHKEIIAFGIDDHFIPHATQEEQRVSNNLDVNSVYSYLNKIIKPRLITDNVSKQHA